MTAKPKQTLRRQARAALSYRTPMPITERCVRWNGVGYYLCPRCRITLDREFASYCDRCGQCLNWSSCTAAAQADEP